VGTDSPRAVRRRDALFYAGLIALVGLAFVLRLPGLADKPLHSDEGVNGWFSLRLYWWNYYVYTHSDYHGPFLYYWNVLWFWLLGGPSDEALRMGTVVTGSLMPLTLVPARRFVGGLGVLMAGLLLVVAPCFVYFSRTNIHEIHLIFGTCAWAVGMARFAAEPRMRWGLMAAGGAAFAFINKETALITMGSLGLAAGVAWLFGRREAGDGRNDEPDLFGGRDQHNALVDWTVNAWPIWAAGAIAFSVVIILFFSSFFTYWNGVGGFFAAYGPWAGYGVSGRNQGKEFGYFFELMQLTQGLVLWMSVPAALWAIWRRHRLGLALLTWLASAFLVYSSIKYKTPWCVLNIDVAAFLLVGWGSWQGWLAARDIGLHPVARGLALVLMLAPLVAVPGLLKQSLYDTEDGYDDKKTPYVYVQTQRGFYGLLEDALGVADARPDDDGRGLRTLSAEAKNPYRWYVILQGWDHDRARYIKQVPKQKWIDKADLVTATGKHLYKTQQLMAEQADEWHLEKYPLRPGYKVHAWYRQELWDAYQAAGGRELSMWPREPSDDILVPKAPKAVRQRKAR